MKSPDERHDELESRERELREREVEIRLREMESDINSKDARFHQTVKHQSEKTQKPSMKKAILGGKLFLLGVVAVVAVKVAVVVSGAIIVGLLVWVSYKLFLDSKKNKS